MADFLDSIIDVLIKMALGHGYDSKKKDDRSRLLASSLIFYGSVGVTATATTILLYKSGWLRKLCPAVLRPALEDVATSLAEATAPPDATRMARWSKPCLHHLNDVYGGTAKKLLASFLGSYLFFKAPHLPMPLAVTATVSTWIAIAAVPRTHINPRSRKLLGFCAGFGAGYVFGPINWIMFDVNKNIGIACLATMAGFNLAGRVTRGYIAYFLGAQAISTSLAIIGTNLVMRKAYFESGGRYNREQLALDANGVLFFQMVGNTVLLLAHTLPNFWRWKEMLGEEQAPAEEQRPSADDDVYPPKVTKPKSGTSKEVPSKSTWWQHRVEDVDPDFESLMIFGCACAGVWAIFRSFTMSILRGMIANKRQEKISQEAKKQVDWVESSGTVVSAFAFAWLYLKFVAYVQRKQTTFLLNWARSLFKAVTPFAMV